MSFDIFVQRFAASDAAKADGRLIEELLKQMVGERGASWARVETADGGADVYGLDDPSSGLMFNHVEGDAMWDLIIELADRAGFAILPTGCGTFVTDDQAASLLPSEAPQPVRVARSGTELRSAIEAS